MARHLRAGDLVEVRSLKEILATLDSAGTLEGMPFMQEMVRYCGKRFRVAGQGIEKDAKKGDLIVQMDVDVPDKLTEEQEKAMKEFADASGLKY